MRNRGRIGVVSSRSRSLSLLADKFSDVHLAAALLDEFLRRKAYSKQFCLKLLNLARQKHEVPWDVRRLAILMLEHQILKLDVGKPDQFDFLLVQLKLKPAAGLSIGVVASVLREGFSTTELRPFISEFRTKLARLNRVHNKIQGARTSPAALREFIQLSRQDCKLSLARYLFTPEETVAEIKKQLQITDGVRDRDTSEPDRVESEMKRALKRLPDFEANVLKRLCARSDIYWVSETTSSEINALVEYPLTTVVLVIKLPGSDVEFEIKRAGRRGEHSLNVVYSRNGYTVPPSHRLDGGSMQWLLRYEVGKATKLAQIYRLVHRDDVPMGNYITRTSISSLPSPNGPTQTLSYFTQPENFGKGFRGMRRAMKESVAAFKSEGNTNLPDMPGDWGLSAQFLGQVQPAQAILSGTSSFRLDKLAAYLAADGPANYFRKGLKVDYTADDAQAFADTILEEVLGCHQPPDEPYLNHEQYVTAALSVAENRMRADLIYKSLLQQIGKFWGTLLAVRGYTRGESFVARNVALKSFWHEGSWEVKAIFLDHDAMVLPNPPNGRFFAHGDIPNMTLDERYIWNRTDPKRFAASEVGCLQSIYRVGKKVDAEAQKLAHAELKKAYQKTQHELLTNPDLQPMFSKGMLERLRDWDALVGGFLKMNGDKATTAKWKREMKQMMAAKKYPKDAFDAYLAVMKKNKEFLVRNSFLYQTD